MFKRPHHQRIQRLLHALDSELFASAECYFGGGTAIVLALDEYRESLDVDFLCASHDGYRQLRSAVFNQGLAGLLRQPLKALRDVRADRYGIRTFIEIDGVPIKFEIVQEGRITLSGQTDPGTGVPTLERADMYAEKLLANADRWGDKATAGRDIIDLALMIHHWGPIPASAWCKTQAAYGPSVDAAFRKAAAEITDTAYLNSCLDKMQMDRQLALPIQTTLQQAMATAQEGG